MKIVIISYAFFPRQSPRSYRATELAKYFAKQGHDVNVFASLSDYDYNSFMQKYNVKVYSIGKLFWCRLHERNSIIDKVLSRWLGNLLEYPYIELVGKVKRIVRRLNNVDMLITIAMPHPIHWGVAYARKKYPNDFPKVWISDCGDPYMGNPMLSKHPFYFRKIEDFWGKKTDYITIPIEEGREAYSATVKDKIRVIPQGFDFNNVVLGSKHKEDGIIRFAYAGAVYPKYRDPSKMLDYLVTKKNIDFQFVVYTKTKECFLLYKQLLGEKLVVKDYVPREQLIYELSQMDFLVNLINDSSVQAPSKLIDYYLTELPIIDISSSFREQLIFDEFLRMDYHNKHRVIDISKYDINNVGQEFLDLFAINNTIK